MRLDLEGQKEIFPALRGQRCWVRFFQLHADELATILLFRLQLLSDAPHFDERQRCSYRNQTAEDNEHNEVHLRRPQNMTQAGALVKDPRRRARQPYDSAEQPPDLLA